MWEVAGVARWGLLTAGAAPVLLIGGWTLAAARQPEAYDAGRETISALAGLGATDRWLMTAALAGLGLCHVGTALALRPAARAGRVVLAVGGVATVGVALLPLPVEGESPAHFVVASAAFAALAVWPALGWRSGRTVPWGVRRRVAGVACAGLAGLVGWLAVEVATDRPLVGLAERAAAGAQALWPLAVVASGLAGSGLARRAPRAVG